MQASLSVARIGRSKNLAAAAAGLCRRCVPAVAPCRRLSASTHAPGEPAESEAHATRWLEIAAAKTRSRDALDPPLALGNVRVVLVSPKSAENVGAAARACDNFEAGSLVLVAPRCELDSAAARRVGLESPTLLGAAAVSTLDEALRGTVAAVAFTRRDGALRRVAPSLDALLASLPGLFPEPEESESEPEPEPGSDPDSRPAAGVVALVFGREESGLTESEVAVCAAAVCLPSGRLQPSLNLSHAVAVALGRLFAIRTGAPGGGGRRRSGWEGYPRAGAADVDRLVERLGAAGAALGLPSVAAEQAAAASPGGRHRKGPLSHLRSVLLRGGLDTQELRSISGLVSDLHKRAGGGGGDRGAEDTAGPGSG